MAGIRLDQDEQARVEQQVASVPLVNSNGSEFPYGTGKSISVKKEGVDPVLFEEVMQELTGGKSPEQIHKQVESGKWPFAISADQMREDLKNWSSND